MSYLRKIITAILPLVITYLVSIFALILVALIYNLLGYNSIEKFLTLSPIFISIIYIVIIIFLIKKYPIKEKKSSKHFFYISLGISLSIFLNMILFKYFPKNKVDLKISLLLNIISSGIIGPIYEEIIFRHILYNQLKNFNSTKKSLYITTIIFSLIHVYPQKIIYAFILGLILNKIYEKDKNIISPILIHISANITSLFLVEYNPYLLYLSFLNILINYYILTHKW